MALALAMAKSILTPNFKKNSKQQNSDIILISLFIAIAIDF
jgi:hypothetical protein